MIKVHISLSNNLWTDLHKYNISYAFTQTNVLAAFPMQSWAEVKKKL